MATVNICDSFPSILEEVSKFIGAATMPSDEVDVSCRLDVGEPVDGRFVFVEK